MKLSELLQRTEAFAPLSYSREYCERYDAYDNSGILLDSGEEVTKALFSLDFSSAALDEAERIGADAIVTHHPVIYGKIGKIGQNAFGKNVQRAIRKGISLISMHLNFDVARGGIDEQLMQGIGGEKGEIIEPLGEEGVGYGRVYSLPVATAAELTQKINCMFHTSRTLCYGGEKIVRRAASFCGAGASEEGVERSVAAGADCIISSDFKHHVIALAMEYGVSVIAMTHYACENYGFEKIYEKIKGTLGVESAYFCDERLL